MVECRLSLVAHFDDELVRNRKVLTEDIETGTIPLQSLMSH